MEPQALSQHPFPHGEGAKAPVQYRLPRGEGHGGVEASEDGFLLLGIVQKILRLPLQPPPRRLHAVHLLFQQPPAVGVLAAEAALLVLHPVVDLPPAAQLPVVVLPLLFRHLVLMVEALPPEGQIVPIAHARHGDAAAGLPDQLLHVDDDVGAALDQGLVVGNVEDGLFCVPDKVLQPAEGIDVQVIGGLVQEQDIRLLHEQAAQLHFHLLPAGEGAQKLRGIAEIGVYPQALQKFGFPEYLRAVEVLRHSSAFQLLRQHLGQIGHFPVGGDLPGNVAVVLHQLPVIDGLQQGGFPVALLPDEHRLVSPAQGEAEAFRQAAVVTLQK